MKTKIRITIIVSSFFILHSAFGQGSLMPPGPPAPMMKSLDQIEARTPISSVPFVIRQPGAYYLTTNVTATAGDAIDIATNGVTLDLNGFTIFSTLNPANGIAIGFDTGVSDVTILNGHIVSGVTNNAGVFSGIGFGYGISGPSLSNVRVTGVSVAGCLYDGINLPGTSTVVDSCTVQTVGSSGIIAAVVSHCAAYTCGVNPISASDTASDCYGNSVGNSTGIYARNAINCSGYSTGGYGLAASTAENCLGYSGSYTGLSATTAHNCYGEGDGSYDGVLAQNADNCFGYSSGGDGVYAVTANNCLGQSYSGYGLLATAASNCYGESSANTGLSAFIGNSCSGTSLSITHPFNCY